MNNGKEWIDNRSATNSYKYNHVQHKIKNITIDKVDWIIDKLNNVQYEMIQQKIDIMFNKIDWTLARWTERIIK